MPRFNPIDLVLSEAGGSMEKETRWNTWYVVIELLAVVHPQAWWTLSRNVDVIPDSQFEASLVAGKIAEVLVRE